MRYPVWYTRSRMTGGVIGWQMWFVIAIDPDYKLTTKGCTSMS
jgi:hypothetical protein